MQARRIRFVTRTNQTQSECHTSCVIGRMFLVRRATFLSDSLRHERSREFRNVKLTQLQRSSYITSPLHNTVKHITIMSKIPGSAHMNFSVGGLVMIGGAMGYFKRGSKVSLLAGLTFGSLLVGSGVMISGDQQYEGHALATGASGVMALAMGQRFLSTGKFMPAGLVATLGAACCAYNLKKAIEWAPSRGGTFCCFCGMKILS